MHKRGLSAGSTRSESGVVAHSGAGNVSEGARDQGGRQGEGGGAERGGRKEGLGESGRDVPRGKTGRKAQVTRVQAGELQDEESGCEDDELVPKSRGREMDVQASGCTGTTFTYTSGEDSD